MPPDWRDTVERYGLDDIECALAVDAERVQPGQEPLQGEPDSGGPFGAMKRLDIPLVAIPLDRSAQEHYQVHDAIEAVEFVAVGNERLRVRPWHGE
jgi:hypothetical protein